MLAYPEVVTVVAPDGRSFEKVPAGEPLAVPGDALSELVGLEREYLSAQAAVVEAVEAATNAIEAAAELRVRYVELHGRLLKQGVVVPPRVMRGSLPGQTSPTGLRERWRRAIWTAW